MNDLLLRALRCEDTPRRPLWIMRQAGRYLPEYRELRAKYSFLEMCQNPEAAAKVTLMPFERFPLDGAIVFADLMSPVPALGREVDFAPGPVVADPVRTAKDVASLRSPAQEDIGPEVMETLARVKEGLNGRATLLGFAGAPWSIAAYMVQGKGAKGFPELRILSSGSAIEIYKEEGLPQ